MRPLFRPCMYAKAIPYGRVVQSVETMDLGSMRCGFESCHGYHNNALVVQTAETAASNPVQWVFELPQEHQVPRSL